MDKLTMLQVMGFSVLMVCCFLIGLSVELYKRLPTNYKAWALAPYIFMLTVLGDIDVQHWIITFFGGFLK